MYKVVLLRHGESTWNKENRFTGWTDVDLSEKGLAGSKKSRTSFKERRIYFRSCLHISFKKSNQNFMDYS